MASRVWRSKKHVRLGELLVQAGHVTEQQIAAAVEQQHMDNDGRRLGDYLIERGVISEQQLISAIRDQIGIEYVDLNMAVINPEMAQIIPRSVAYKHHIIPLGLTREGQLRLAMADPLDFIAIDEAQATSHKGIVPVIAARNAIDRAMINLYSNERAQSAIGALQDEFEKTGMYEIVSGSTVSGEAADVDDDGAAPAIRLVNSIIDRAYTDFASDIHVEPGEEEMEVRMRVDGSLRVMLVVPFKLQAAVISRFKIMGNIDIAQKNIPQDGRAKVKIHDDILDLRISTLPTIYGEKVVLRLLRKTNSLSTMEGVGLKGDNLKLLHHLVDDTTEGVILMVGPTGSGKTSTLRTIIDRKKNVTVNLISLEDPVEYNIKGVTQVQMNEKAGLTFASSLRSVLRQDPDIIAVGEIRDGETAEICMAAAMTGHLVFSTIHTNNAVSSIDRLLNIGVEPYMISGAVKGIISQRLLKRICPNCREEYDATPDEVQFMRLDPGKKYRFCRGKGCPECGETGYKGRIGAFEILKITRSMQRAINASDTKQLEEAVKTSGFKTILHNCQQLVLEGTSTVEEVHRTIGVTMDE